MKRVFVQIAVTQEQKDLASYIAQREGRSLSNYLGLILTPQLNRELEAHAVGSSRDSNNEIG